MSNQPKKNARNFEYPDVTVGSKTAGELRSEANQLTDAQREHLFAQGMQIIYGGDAKKIIGTRHSYSV